MAAAAACLVVALGSAPAGAGEFLPRVGLFLEAAHYSPVETDLHWTGTMGGGADVFEIGGVRGYISGRVETIIGNTRRGFDANQANYHLETGLSRRVGPVWVRPFFSHVSRHLVDREKVPAVDWNILGVGADGVVAGGRVRVGGGIGHTTLASLVGYEWEVTGRADADLVHREHFTVYGAARARLVTIDPDPLLPRDDFLDFAFEGGLRVPRERRVLEAFAAFERRNDVFLLRPGARDRLLLGLRIRLATE